MALCTGLEPVRLFRATLLFGSSALPITLTQQMASAFGLEPKHRMISDYSRLSKTIPCQLGLCRHMVGREGFEPPRSEDTWFTVRDAASYALSTHMVGEEGLEPSVFRVSRFYRPLPSPLGYSPILYCKIYLVFNLYCYLECFWNEIHFFVSKSLFQ